MDNKSESELAAVLAHEVKNPLAIIKTNIDCIKSILPKEGEKNIEVIDNAIMRLDRIIEGYRLMAVKTENSELIYIEDMLIDIIEDYNISKPSIEFIYNCNSELSFYGNYDKLSILFYNLYKNAIEAIGEKGVVKTEVHSEDNMIVIKISDSGKGIEDLNALGTPYYTTKENGTGLGIIICKNIVEEHGGRLYFKNNDVGSSVIVALPINNRVLI